MILFPFIPFFLQLINLSLPLLRCILFSLSGKDSSLVLRFHFTQNLLSRLRVDVHQDKGISNKIVFYKFIQGSVSGKTGSMVDLQ